MRGSPPCGREAAQLIVAVLQRIQMWEMWLRAPMLSLSMEPETPYRFLIGVRRFGGQLGSYLSARTVVVVHGYCRMVAPQIYLSQASSYIFRLPLTVLRGQLCLNQCIARLTTGQIFSGTGTNGAVQGTDVIATAWYDFVLDINPGEDEEDYPYYIRFYFDVGHTTDDAAIADVRFQVNPTTVQLTMPPFPASSAGAFVNVGDYGELSTDVGIYYDDTYGSALNLDTLNLDLNGQAVKDGSTTLLWHTNGVTSLLSEAQNIVKYTIATDTVELGGDISDTVKIWGTATTMGHTVLGQSNSYNTTISGAILNTGMTGTSSYLWTKFDTATGRLYYYTSTEKIKNNIQPHDKGLLVLNALRPVSFDMKNGETDCLGFIAEEVHAVDTTLFNPWS